MVSLQTHVYSLTPSLSPSISIGLFSSLMRDLSEKSSDSPKWIVLDGDIDPMWIESLNTVMDDNKVTLYIYPSTHSLDSFIMLCEWTTGVDSGQQ